MALRQGLAAIRSIKLSQESNSSGAGLRLILNEGDTALLRFYGDFEDPNGDPIIGSNHYVQRLQKGKQYNSCGENNPTICPQCVFCFAKDHGDKGIGKQNRAYFRVRDFRKQHKLDNEVRILKQGVSLPPGQTGRPEDYEVTKWPTCLAPKRMCMFCAQGNKANEIGHRYWELAVTYADQLVSQQNVLRDFCKCGGRTEDGSGTISVQQYICQNCQNVVEFYPEQGKPVAHCHQCQQTLAPLESIACSACGNPQRCSIQDFFFRVTKSGSGTDTSYNFAAVHPCRPPKEDELKEAEEKKPDFEKILAPDPAEIQASILAIANPFPATAGHGAQPYANNPGVGPTWTGPSGITHPMRPNHPLTAIVPTGPVLPGQPNPFKSPRPEVVPLLQALQKPVVKFGAQPATAGQVKPVFKIPKPPVQDDSDIPF